MTDLAWMKTYIGTETALTGHLTAEEFGAYERLRRHHWQHRRLPDDETRLMRIAGVEPEQWHRIASAIVPLLAEALPRLDQERAEAAAKREKKVAAGRKGAASRWQNGTTSANANSKTMATAMADASFCQWPSASASDEVRYEERLVPTRTHARDLPSDHSPTERIDRRFSDKNGAGAWLAAQGGFPGDPAFDRCVDKLVDGTATWGDVERAAA